MVRVLSVTSEYILMHHIQNMATLTVTQVAILPAPVYHHPEPLASLPLHVLDTFQPILHRLRRFLFGFALVRAQIRIRHFMAIPQLHVLPSCKLQMTWPQPVHPPRLEEEIILSFVRGIHPTRTVSTKVADRLILMVNPSKKLW